VYSPPPRPKEKSYITFEGLMQNCLSRGTITVDEKGHLVVDPNFLSNPFDMRVAIETIRAILRISLSSKWKGDIKAMLWGPEIKWSPDLDIDGIPDEILAAFVRKVINHGNHQMSTLAMGKDDEGAVDKDFRLRGFDGLRVVDLSVCPILTNNHTQVNAYVIGEVAARKIIKENGGAIMNGKNA
jgi:choline dehydrogenase-like flavoprotein